MELIGCLGRWILISVIITAYDRRDKLEQTLLGFQKQNVDERLIDYEIIVVDNHPSSVNRKLIEQLNNGSDKQIYYFHEPIRGKCYAQNTGIKKASHNILTFADEDNIPEANYLLSIAAALELNEEVFVVTGRILPFGKDDALLTIKTQQEKQVYSWPCSPWVVGHGSNFTIKKSILKSIGFYDVLFGPGTQIGSAEDTDFIYRILKKGYKIFYCPDIVNYHNHGRSEKKDVDAIKFNYAKGRGAFYTKHILRGDSYAARLCYWEIKNLLINFLRYETFSNNQRRNNILLNLKGLVLGFYLRLATVSFPIVGLK